MTGYILIQSFESYSKNWYLQKYALFFLCLLRNIDFGYSLEPLILGGFNE